MSIGKSTAEVAYKLYQQALKNLEGDDPSEQDQVIVTFWRLNKELATDLAEVKRQNEILEARLSRYTKDEGNVAEAGLIVDQYDLAKFTLQRYTNQPEH